MSKLLTYGIMQQKRKANLLLDTYTGAAGAWSLRKLRTAYSGYCINVKRSSDNATQDIGFTSSGVLDESALTSFVGANNAFVTKWYDQSGNGTDFYYINNGPKIITSGSIHKQNELPSLYFEYSVLPGLFADFTGTLTSECIFTAFSQNCTTNHSRLFSQRASGANDYTYYMPILRNDTSDSWGTNADGGYRAMNTISKNTFCLFSNLHTGTQIKNYLNGDSEQTYNHTLNHAVVRLTLGDGAWNDDSKNWGAFTGYISEVIMYNSDQSSNKSGIETNINSFYSIY